MADISSILPRKEARLGAKRYLGGILKTLFPTQKLIDLDNTATIPNDAYISIEELSDGVINGAGLGVRKISEHRDVNGNITTVYHTSITYRIKFYKTGAKDCANDFIEYISNRDFDIQHYNELYSLTNISDRVISSRTSINFTDWEEGAVVTLNVNYLFKREILNSVTIDKVEFTATTKSMNGDISLLGYEEGFWFELGYSSIQEYFDSVSNLYDWTNGVGDYTQSGVDFTNTWK